MLMKAVGRLSHRLSFERLAGGGVEAWKRTAVLREDESSLTVTQTLLQIPAAMV